MKHERIRDVVLVGNFIAWHENGYIMGGVQAEEAFEAFCRIIGVDNIEEFRKILLMEYGNG